MNKNEENKLIDAIISLSQEIKGLRKEFMEQGKNTEKQLAKINLTLGEMRLSYMKLNESFNKYAESNNSRVDGHEKRIIHLEDETFGGGGKQTYMAKEPKVGYVKRKKKK